MMEHFITAVSYEDAPYLLNKNNELSIRFTIMEEGEALINVIGSVPNGDWGTKDRESGFVTLFVDGNYNQDLILFNGEQPFSYERLLGELSIGDHELTLVFQGEKSSKQINETLVHMIEVHQIRKSDPDFMFYGHAPLIYGRNLTHPYESSFTDTPLVLFYYCDQHDDGTMTIEYHMIFSHEDGGTVADELMSKWGRTSDIEWAYRVKVDQHGKRILEDETETYQGADHITTPFEGKRDLGAHPVLQSATDNGNFSDEIRSYYRYLLKPAVCLPRNVNREAVMDLYPWTYAVAVKEVRRQLILEENHNAHTALLSDPAHYLYIQTSKYTDGGRSSLGKAGFYVRLANDERMYSSIHDDFNEAYDGADGPFATTVKLPIGTEMGDIVEISAYKEVTDENKDTSVTVKGIRKAFFLGEDNLPVRPFINCNNDVKLTASHPNQVLWHRND